MAGNSGGVPTRDGLRIVSYNAYLIPNAIARARDDADTCRRQDERAAGLGKTLSLLDCDLVGLQEMWGSQVSQVERFLEREFYIPQRFRSVRSPFGGASLKSSVLDTLKYALSKTGGLFVAVRKDLPVIFEDFETFSSSGTKSGKGMYACLVDTRSREQLNFNYLLFLNCHLDPGHTDLLQTHQKEQIKELARFAARCVARYVTERQDDSVGFDTQDLAVLVVGDFNAEWDDSVGRVLQDELCKPRELRSEYARVKGESVENSYDETNKLCMWPPSANFDLIVAVSRLLTEDSFASVDVAYASLLTQKPGSEISDHWGALVDLGNARSDKPQTIDLTRVIIASSLLPSDKSAPTQMLYLGVTTTGGLCLTHEATVWVVDQQDASLSLESGGVLALAAGEKAEKLANLRVVSREVGSNPLRVNLPSIAENPRIGAVAIAGTSLVLDVDNSVATANARVTLWTRKLVSKLNQQWEIRTAGFDDSATTGELK